MYEYRLWDVTTLTWTEWVPIEDPDTMLRRGEGFDDRMDVDRTSGTDAVYPSIDVQGE